ncbi:SDR family NAD(P)-dependent oxidoreductase [Microbacterium invictum]|uniref:SDR family NAD(P)-dependent oxidoreductase n=1 Tax=Microbacterium invictum TaxID=515415 RepID=UPI001617A8DE
MVATRNPVAGATVLITGAARGMGALYARRALAAGARALALWDIDQAALDEQVTELRASGADVRGYRVDISQLEEIRAGAARVREELGAPQILINNAGIVRGAPFWEHDDVRDIEGTMRVNALAAMWLTRQFLPDMMADAGRPHRILNIASAAGTLANPNMSVYAASKWALIGWSDSLRLELVASGHRHIAVTTFCPSYISTGMFAGARGPLLTPIMTPRAATRAAWHGMLRGTPMVLRPWTVKLAMALRGVLPTRVWDLVADRVFKVYSSMDEFTGRPAD